jgi:hypothetical protein
VVEKVSEMSLARRALAAGCVCALGVQVLAGCTGGSGDSGDAASSPAAQVQSGTIEQPPAMGSGAKDILADVSVEACPTDPGEVTAKGTVENTSKKERDVAVVMMWTRPDGGDPLLRLVFTEEDVPAGKTVDWSMTGDLPAKADSCVISATSGTLSGK